MIAIPGVRARRVALFALPLAFLVSSQVSRAQSPDPKLLGYPAVGAPPVVTLLSAGAQPQTKLRYVVAKDYKSGMNMAIDIGITVTMDATPLPLPMTPTTKIGVNLSVTDVSPTGDITYGAAFTGISAEVPPGGDAVAMADVIKQMQTFDADFKTITGVVTVTPRGFSQSAKFDFSKVTNPQMKQMLTSVSNSLENMSMPLPEEAVGVGARWEVKQSTSANGMQTLQRTTFEMTAFDGTTATLKAKLEQSAPPQQIQNDLMPGMTMFLKQLSGGGDGTIALKLNSLVPSSEIKTDTNATMEMEMAGQKTTMGMVTKTKLTIGPIK